MNDKDTREKALKILQNALKEIVDNINFINTLNPNCYFEVGTEESIFPFDEHSLEFMLIYLKNELDDDLFEKIVYCVVQSGTKIERTKNIGKFNIKRLEN